MKKLKPGKGKWHSDFIECIWHLLSITQMYPLLRWPFPRWICPDLCRCHRQSPPLGLDCISHTVCPGTSLMPKWETPHGNPPNIQTCASQKGRGANRQGCQVPVVKGYTLLCGMDSLKPISWCSSEGWWDEILLTLSVASLVTPPCVDFLYFPISFPLPHTLAFYLHSPQ